MLKLNLLFVAWASGQSWQDAADATTGATGGLGATGPISPWAGWVDGRKLGQLSGVELPSTCGQSVRLRGIGTQNYICSQGAWVLSEPMATLHHYASEQEIDVEIVGYHYFNRPADCSSGSCTAGGSPGWKLGKGCTMTGCDMVDETFTGSSLTAKVDSPNADSVAWLLVNGGVAASNSSGILHQTTYLQRLDTMGGAPTVATYPMGKHHHDSSWGEPQNSWGTVTVNECSKEGEMLNVPYECDYIFSKCGSDAPTEKPAYPIIDTELEISQEGVSLPISNVARSVQSVFSRGVGTQNYFCSNGSGWKLMEPRAYLHNYIEGSSRRMDKNVNGFHYFATVGQPGGRFSPDQPGGAPGWIFAGDHTAIDHTNTTILDKFVGSLVRKAAQTAGTIAWLLVKKASSSGDALGDANYLQRLSTVSGAVPSSVPCTGANVGETYQMAYECDYFFAKPTYTPPLSWKFSSAFGYGYKLLTSGNWGWGWGSPGWGWFSVSPPLPTPPPPTPSLPLSPLSLPPAPPAITDAQIAAFYQKVGSSEDAVRSASSLFWTSKNLNDNDLAVMSHIFLSIGSMGALTSLWLSGNNIGDQGMIAFSNAIASGSMGSLQQLELGGNAFGDAGMIAFADALKSPIGSMGSLERLYLSSNQIGDAGMISLSEAIGNGSMGVLTNLWLSNNNIGDQGMIAFSNAIASGSMGELSYLYLLNNPISEATETTIRTAASDRNIILTI